MAFASDNFTGVDGTVLETYSANWTKVTGGGGADLLINANTLYASAANDWQMHLWNAAQAASADYDVQATVAVTNQAHVSPLVAGRIVSSSNGDGYAVRYAEGGWALYQSSGGSKSTLGTYTGDVPTTPKVCLLRMVGNQISVLIDGTLRIGPVTGAITAKGYAGLCTYYSDAGTNRNIDTWSAIDAVGGGLSIPVAMAQYRQRWS